MAARMSVKKPNRLEFAVRDCSIHSVVVYKDRAEVKRIIRAELLEGTNEVVISGLAETINRNSIRYVTLQTIPFLCDFSSIPDDAGLMHSRMLQRCYTHANTHAIIPAWKQTYKSSHVLFYSSGLWYEVGLLYRDLFDRD